MKVNEKKYGIKSKMGRGEETMMVVMMVMKGAIEIGNVATVRITAVATKGRQMAF